MTDDVDVKGRGGAVVAGYQTAAVIDAWELSSGGPGVYILKAQVARAVEALLAFAPITIWIPRNTLRWMWTVDEVSIVDGRLEAVLGQPKLAPLAGG